MRKQQNELVPPRQLTGSLEGDVTNQQRDNNMKYKHFKHIGTIAMTLTDLCDTKFAFSCETAPLYFDYSLTAKVHDYYYYQSLNESEVDTLRMNCKKILEATEGLK